METDLTILSRTTNHSPELNSINLNRKFQEIRRFNSGKNLLLIDIAPFALPTVATILLSSTPKTQIPSISKPYIHLKNHSFQYRLRGISCIDDSFILKSTTLKSTSPDFEDSLKNDRRGSNDAFRFIRSRPRNKLSSPKQLERLFNRHFIKRISPNPRTQFPSISSRSEKNRLYKVTDLKSSVNMRKVVKPPSSGGFIIKPCISIISAQVSRR